MQTRACGTESDREKKKEKKENENKLVQGRATELDYVCRLHSSRAYTSQHNSVYIHLLVLRQTLIDL